MNEGNYPDEVINKAIDRINEGNHPKDVTDELRQEYGYERLHPKTVVSWHRKYPVGKSPKTLPTGFVDKMREVVQGLDQEDKEDRGRPCVQHVFTRETEREKAPSKPLGAVSSEKIAEVERCRFCGFEKRRTRFFHIALN